MEVEEAMMMLTIPQIQKWHVGSGAKDKEEAERVADVVEYKKMIRYCKEIGLELPPLARGLGEVRIKKNGLKAIMEKRGIWSEYERWREENNG